MPLDAGPFLGLMGIRLMEVFRSTEALRILPSLQESQYWDHERLRSLQGERLQQLARHCAETVPYYRRLFKQLGYAPEDFRDVSDVARLPVLTKSDIRAAGDDLRSSLFNRLQPRRKSTSGSSGVPLNYYLDRTSHSYLWAQIWRAWSQAGYRPGDHYATLSGGALLPEKVDFRQRVYQALSGAVHLPSYHLTDSIMDRYRRLLRRRRIAFLHGYPSSIEFFAEFCLSEPRQPLRMRAIFTTSEMLSPKARATIEQAFSGRVLDINGCNDGGLYCFECAHTTGFHYGMESVILEIVDDAGRPLPEGGIGQIITTHLTNRAHPFLRYATGDTGALASARCACGRGLGRIVSFQGRERDFVLTPDGRRVHGAFFNHFEPFYRSPWIERFQVYQPDRTSLVVRLATGRPPTAAEQEELIAQLRRGLGGLAITLDLSGRMELTRAGKFRVVVSEVTK